MISKLNLPSPKTNLPLKNALYTQKTDLQSAFYPKLQKYRFFNFTFFNIILTNIFGED